MKKIVWLLLSLLCSTALATPESEFQVYVSERMSANQVVGSAIVVIEDHQIKHPLYSGLLSADGDQSISSDTVFQVGSVSKPVAAWTAMSLVEIGDLDLDAPISTYLSRWQIPESEFDAHEVTLRRLLSHTAGLSLGGYPGFIRGEPLPSTEASLSGDTGGSGAVFIQQTPGAEFSYSGGGYTLMQLIIEEVTGQTFEEVAQERVMGPLGMTNSSYEPSATLLNQQATPHGHRRDVVPDHDFRAQAAASLHSTAEDIDLRSPTWDPIKCLARRP